MTYTLSPWYLKSHHPWGVSIGYHHEAYLHTPDGGIIQISKFNTNGKFKFYTVVRAFADHSQRDPYVFRSRKLQEVIDEGLKQIELTKRHIRRHNCKVAGWIRRLKALPLAGCRALLRKLWNRDSYFCRQVFFQLPERRQRAVGRIWDIAA